MLNWFHILFHYSYNLHLQIRLTSYSLALQAVYCDRHRLVQLQAAHTSYLIQSEHSINNFNAVI